MGHRSRQVLQTASDECKYWFSSACLFCLTWMVCEMRGKRLNHYYFVECWFQDLFKTASSVLMYIPYSILSKHVLKFQVVQTYNSTNTAIAWKFSRFLLPERSNFSNQSKAVHAFLKRMLIRYCYRGMLNGLLILEAYNLIWLWHYLVQNSWTQFYLISRRVQCPLPPAPGYSTGIRLACVCEER